MSWNDEFDERQNQDISEQLENNPKPDEGEDIIKDNQDTYVEEHVPEDDFGSYETKETKEISEISFGQDPQKSNPESSYNDGIYSEWATGEKNSYETEQNGNTQGNQYNNAQQKNGSDRGEYQSSGENYSYAGAYEVPEQEKGSGFAISALIISIISLLFSCCCGGVLGIISLILGIVSLSAKEKRKGIAIFSLVLSVLSIIITAFTIFLSVGFIKGMESGEYTKYIEELAVSETGEDIFSEAIYMEENGSVFQFDSEGGYIYYENINNETAEMQAGTYTFYNAENAYLYLLKNEIDKAMAMGAEYEEPGEIFSEVDDEQLKTMYCLVLDVEESSEENNSGEQIVYYGFYEDEVLDLVSADTWDEYYYISYDDLEEGLEMQSDTDSKQKKSDKKNKNK